MAHTPMPLTLEHLELFIPSGQGNLEAIWSSLHLLLMILGVLLAPTMD
jgi:hypothetical protein